MRRLGGALTYSNVMATIAVFIALGGGAYAVTRAQVNSSDIARDAVKAKHIDFGVRSQVMLASFDGLFTGVGNAVFSPVGGSAAGGSQPTDMLAPETFFATGLNVRLDSALVSGVRTFYFRLNGDRTELECTIAQGERTCRSSQRVKVRRGDRVAFEASNTATSTEDEAAVGWRAVLP